MRNKHMKRLIGIVMLVCSIVAIFGLFGNAFADVNGIPDTRGSVYTLMFHAEKYGYNEMPALTVAFSFLIVAASLTLIGAFFPGRIGGGILGLSTLFLVAAAIILFLTKSIFLGAATTGGAPIYDEKDLALGVGSLLPAIFAVLGGVLGLYGTYVSFKA